MAESSGGQMGTLVFRGGHSIGEGQGMGLTAKSPHTCAVSSVPLTVEWGWGLWSRYFGGAGWDPLPAGWFCSPSWWHPVGPLQVPAQVPHKSPVKA